MQITALDVLPPSPEEIVRYEVLPKVIPVLIVIAVIVLAALIFKKLKKK